MTTIFRLLQDDNKGNSLLDTCSSYRNGGRRSEVFEVDPNRFQSVPSSPFAYWVGDRIVDAFVDNEKLEGEGRRVERGLFTGDDGRFLRCYWEIDSTWISEGMWGLLSKGGAYSPFYYDVHLCVKSAKSFLEIHASIIKKYEYLKGNSDWVLHPECSYKRAGLTYPLRTTSDFSARVLPEGCFWTNKGISIFEADAKEVDGEKLFFMLGLVNSRLFREFLSLRMGAAQAAARSYEEGIVAAMPWPTNFDVATVSKIAYLARRAWLLRRTLDSIEETSHAFVMPASLRARVGDFDPRTIEMELVQIQSEIDAIAFDLYGFSEDDRAAMQNGAAAGSEDDAKDFNDQSDDDSDDEIGAEPFDDAAGLLSWAVGVAFGRYDWRLATAEREAPEDPEPFDPLPTKSPGMLPDGAEPFHAHVGILVDDEGHPHDLPYLLEEVLQRVDAPVQVDTRRWLQREFFSFHLQRYSKSRRKAPIYWPLSTLSGAYTLWLYYPDLTSQTLFTAVNDFIEPKLQQVRGDLDSLRGKGNARSKQEEKQLEVASDLSQELADLRDALLAIAPKYSPNHDDGVQITAAPLWQLFRHKPWQKVLNDIWEKLEQGDYDWSHLAMNYWPERVLRKCHQDRSLAIAHDVEDTFWYEVEVPVMRGKRPTGETKLEWQPKELTESELDALIQAKIMEKKA